MYVLAPGWSSRPAARSLSGHFRGAIQYPNGNHELIRMSNRPLATDAVQR